ncbi:hypothetical protein [Bacillus sp. JCM 19041]|uniref:hypothetical protein n=1 Tax=Bacillus sp. JCM 19041 TaxID=1460637 RepID=UPI0012E2E0D8
MIIRWSQCYENLFGKLNGLIRTAILALVILVVMIAIVILVVMIAIVIMTVAAMIIIWDGITVDAAMSFAYMTFRSQDVTTESSYVLQDSQGI